MVNTLVTISYTLYMWLLHISHDIIIKYIYDYYKLYI